MDMVRIYIHIQRTGDIFTIRVVLDQAGISDLLSDVGQVDTAEIPLRPSDEIRLEILVTAGVVESVDYWDCISPYRQINE